MTSLHVGYVKLGWLHCSQRNSIPSSAYSVYKVYQSILNLQWHMPVLWSDYQRITPWNFCYPMLIKNCAEINKNLGNHFYLVFYISFSKCAFWTMSIHMKVQFSGLHFRPTLQASLVMGLRKLPFNPTFWLLLETLKFVKHCYGNSKYYQDRYQKDVHLNHIILTHGEEMLSLN